MQTNLLKFNFCSENFLRFFLLLNRNSVRLLIWFSMFTRQNRSHAKCQVKIYDVHNTISRKLTELRGANFPCTQLFCPSSSFFFRFVCVFDDWRMAMALFHSTTLLRTHSINIYIKRCRDCCEWDRGAGTYINVPLREWLGRVESNEMVFSVKPAHKCACSSISKYQ